MLSLSISEATFVVSICYRRYGCACVKPMEVYVVGCMRIRVEVEEVREQEVEEQEEL